MTTMNTSKHSLDKRKVRLLLDRDLRNRYVSDQIKIGLRNQLRSLRDERGITQAELAKMIGTKQSVISRIERDPVRVGLPIFMDIAEKFDVALVVRFEAIDTFVEWYDNLTPQKMTPDPSEQILRDKARTLISEIHTMPDVFYWTSPHPVVTKSVSSISLVHENVSSNVGAPRRDFISRFGDFKDVIELKNVDIPEPVFDRFAAIHGGESLDTPRYLYSK